MMGFDEVKSRLTHLETDRHEMTHDPPADVIRSPHSLRSTPLYEAKYSNFIRFSTFSISVIKAHRPSIFLKARGVACSCYIRLMLETQSCRRTLYNTMKPAESSSSNTRGSLFDLLIRRLFEGSRTCIRLSSLRRDQSVK
jgi:hypothetical protein